MDTFRTFCHISEYDKFGYANLHRMIATSAPLVLWAPAGRLIDSTHCRVGAKEFVKLVENKHVRIVAREPWITDQNWRDSRQWEDGRWSKAVDDPIYQIWKSNDRDPNPDPDPPVVIAPEELGYHRATEYFDRHPEEVERIAKAVRAPDARDHYPKGVVDSALRAPSAEKAAEDVVRDAYNHDAALVDARTRIPFLLGKKESSFNQLMATVRTEFDIAFPLLPANRSLTDDQHAELTNQILDLLENLEMRHGRMSTTQFLNIDKERSLACWMANTCSDLAREDAQDIRNVLLQRLYRSFTEGKIDESWTSLLTDKGKLIAGIGLANDILTESTYRSLTVTAAVGVSTSAFAVGSAVAKLAGAVPVPFSGPEWPFLYAFGGQPTRRRHSRLKATLDRLINP